MFFGCILEIIYEVLFESIFDYREQPFICKRKYISKLTQKAYTNIYIKTFLGLGMWVSLLKFYTICLIKIIKIMFLIFNLEDFNS